MVGVGDARVRPANEDGDLGGPTGQPGASRPGSYPRPAPPFLRVPVPPAPGVHATPAGARRQAASGSRSRAPGPLTRLSPGVRGNHRQLESLAAGLVPGPA